MGFFDLVAVNQVNLFRFNNCLHILQLKNKYFRIHCRFCLVNLKNFLIFCSFVFSTFVSSTSVFLFLSFFFRLFFRLFFDFLFFAFLFHFFLLISIFLSVYPAAFHENKCIYPATFLLNKIKTIFLLSNGEKRP
jgi:hypothetical protein